MRPDRTRRSAISRRLPATLLAGLAVVLYVAACRTAAERTPSVRAVDDDGDGRVDRFLTIDDDGEVVRAVEAPAPGSAPDRTVVIAVDGVPYALFERLRAEGRFAAFHPPSRMIAPFPSLTAVSFTEMLGTPPPAAYEEKFFDPVANRSGGGVADRVSGEHRDLSPYHAAFDWEAPRFWGGFVFLVPERIALSELHRAETILRESDDTELLLYLGTTDGLGHEDGWEALEAHLERIDAVLTRWLAAGGGSRRVVLLSDHGMSRVATEAMDLEAALARGGFRLADRMETAADVVAPAYGLIGSIQLYTACGREADVARALAAAPEVEFTVWQDGERRGAFSADGPLDLSTLPPDGYPDVEDRARRGLSLTRHPASVLASLAPESHYGLSLFEPFVSMAGTHGSARAEPSTGFLASNVDATPPVLAAREVRPWLGLSGGPADPDPAPYRCVDASSRSK